MEHRAQADDGRSTFLDDSRWRVALTIAAFGVFFMIVYTSIIPYYPARVIIACVCWVLIGFIQGFRAHQFTVFLPILATALTAFVWMAGVFQLPMDKRYQAMLKAHFLVPYVLAMAVSVLGFYAGARIFRKTHPDAQTEPDDD